MKNPIFQLGFEKDLVVFFKERQNLAGNYFFCQSKRLVVLQNAQVTLQTGYELFSFSSNLDILKCGDSFQRFQVVR